ncbi:MAG: YceI family protein [Polyangiaceae bacterium]|nr:YceI family protein [Polyangiaceae bacterium]
MKSSKLVTLALVLAAAASGCGEKEASPGPAGAAPTAASAAPPAPPVSKTLVKLSVDPGSAATFDIKAPVETIKGLVRGFGGELDVELADLTKTRGAVTMDMTTLETHTFGDDAKDRSQTEHALGWLQIGPASPEEERSKLRLATFTIKDVVSASPKSVVGMAGESRSVTLTANGELSLHGRSAARVVELACVFQYEGDSLKSVSVKTVKPVPVNLKQHDVQPRDDKGEVALAKVLELFGKKVAEEASVTLELVARPKGSPGGAPALPPPAPAGSSSAGKP